MTFIEKSLFYILIVLVAVLVVSSLADQANMRRIEARIDSALDGRSNRTMSAVGHTILGYQAGAIEGHRSVVLLSKYLDSVEEKREHDSVNRRWSRKGYKVTYQDCQPFWDRQLGIGRNQVFLGMPISHIEKDTVTITGIDRNTTITSDTQTRMFQWIGGNRFVIWESRFLGQ